MTHWYQEPSGDYLVAADAESEYSIKAGGFTARATNIEAMPESMVTCTVSRSYLRDHCQRVPKATVPEDWIKWGNL